MVILREAQVDVFRQAALSRFADETLAHVRRHFPEEYEALGEQTARKWVTYGIARARVYHITRQRNVRRYIDLMFAFSHDFDTDPAFPWATEILTEAQEMSETVRLDWLYEMALAALAGMEE